MYAFGMQFILRKNAACFGGIVLLGLFFCVFTLLVSNAAACFASGLAGCLAFAAAAVFSAFTEIASFDSFDMCHFNYLHQNLL